MGEELLTDYLTFVGDMEGFEDDVLSLRRQCAGEGVGSISEYEGRNIKKSPWRSDDE